MIAGKNRLTSLSSHMYYIHLLPCLQEALLVYIQLM